LSDEAPNSWIFPIKRPLGTSPPRPEVITSSPISIAKAFGVIPIKFGLVLINYTGAALAASGHSVKYIPVYKTVV